MPYPNPTLEEQEALAKRVTAVPAFDATSARISAAAMERLAEAKKKRKKEAPAKKVTFAKDPNPTLEEQEALAKRVTDLFSSPALFDASFGRINYSAVAMERLAEAKKKKEKKRKEAPAKKGTVAKVKKRVVFLNNDDNKSTWPKVKSGEYDYVYICAGPFDGRFGYYYEDKEEDNAMVYFGSAALAGDNPYVIPLRYLSAPPDSYKKKNAFSLFKNRA